MGSESGGPRASTSSLANSRSQRRGRDGLSAPLRLASHAVDASGSTPSTRTAARTF